MIEIKSNEEYYSRREAVISKFTKEFIENYQKKDYDPIFRKVLEYIIRGVDPYEIIEELVKDRKKLTDTFKEFVQLHAHPTPTNAKLMAAAPDMLESLTTMVTFLRNNGFAAHRVYKNYITAAQAAIKKATE